LVDSLDELYKEVILDHYQNPRNRGKRSDAQLATRGYNPLCGDELELFIDTDGEKVQQVMFSGRGCSISQASASMMTEALTGRSLEEAARILAAFKEMLTASGDPSALVELGAPEDLESLQSIKRYPVRVKCALLPWNTFAEAVEMYEARRT
jgi:nitrogen fixation NifU-like protein